VRLLAAAFGFVVLLAGTTVQAEESWATKRARDLTEQAAGHRAAGRTDDALSRYRQAIEMDGTYGPAYLGLAELREATGDVDEARQVLLLALEAIPSFQEARVAHADILHRAKRYSESTVLLVEALKLDRDSVPLLEKVLRTAPRAGALPVALGAARRLAALAKARGDDRAAADAEITARALTRLVSEADPVKRGRKHAEQARRALAVAADPRAR
jgi:tetratricopeptide (TPR) repeat protein